MTCLIVSNDAWLFGGMQARLASTDNLSCIVVHCTASLIYPLRKYLPSSVCMHSALPSDHRCLYLCSCRCVMQQPVDVHCLHQPILKAICWERVHKHHACVYVYSSLKKYTIWGESRMYLLGGGGRGVQSSAQALFSSQFVSVLIYY